MRSSRSAGGSPAAWGQMGAAWGVPPSTAMVQGYMLVHGGPVTDKELQDALGLSHRAIRLALEDCEEWGIVRRAAEPRRSGRRGPAGRAWLALDDHWEWFRRVIEARKVREGDPVIAILEQCLVEASHAPKGEDSEDLRRRLESLLDFVAPVRSRTLGRRPCPHRSAAQAVQGAVGAGRQVARSTAQLAGRYSGGRAGVGRRHDLEDAFRLGAPADAAGRSSDGRPIARRPLTARLPSWSVWWG